MAKRMKKCIQRLFEHFFVLIANGFRVSISYYLQRIPGKTEKKGELVVFLGAHKGDKPLEFLSKGLYYISLLLN